MFFPEFWGRGFATEAIKALLSYGFNLLNLEEIIAITQEGNIRSHLLLEKSGMIYTDNLYLFNKLQRRYVLTSHDWWNKFGRCLINPLRK